MWRQLTTSRLFSRTSCTSCLDEANCDCNRASPNKLFGFASRRPTASLAETQLKFYNEMSFKQILADASKLPPHSAIFFHLMNVDAAGIAHETQSALKRLVEASSAPIFSQGDGSFGEGLVGGPMHSIREGSEVAAAVAVRILNGELAGDIKTPPTRFALPRLGGIRCSVGDQREPSSAG